MTLNVPMRPFRIIAFLMLTAQACAASPRAEGDTPASAGQGVRILLKGSSAETEGSGVAVRGGMVVISRAGTYIVSGTLEDGGIVIDAGADATVRLVLAGAAVTNTKGAPLYSKRAKTTVVELDEGSVNILRDGASYSQIDGDEPDAALFSKNDLRIEGPGRLEVVAAFKNGIGTKDDLVISGGDLRIVAESHGIRGRDSVTIPAGTFSIRSGADGIQSNNDEDAEKGWISINGGTFDIASGRDGIQAETRLSVSAGDLTILAGGGRVSSGIPDESYKGLKAVTELDIRGGRIEIDSLDDALHSNGDVTIAGGRLNIAAGDDAVHADHGVTVSGGEINIAASYEGIEGQEVRIAGGTIRVVSSDDGLNGADGSAAGGFGRRSGPVNEGLRVIIEGGWISVNAGGDGLDSNGNVFMSGGTLIVAGSSFSGNAAIDYDGGFALSGGTLAAAGTARMAQAPGNASTQATLMVYFSRTLRAGTSFHLTDSAGAHILSFTPEKDYQTVVISAPALKQGASYTVHSGGSPLDAGRDGLVQGGGFRDGSRLFDVRLSGVTTVVDESGRPAPRPRGSL